MHDLMELFVPTLLLVISKSSTHVMGCVGELGGLELQH